MVSSLNDNEIDFRISFDEFDNEEYTVIFDKNSFSYKIISSNDLKMDTENDNEKFNTPLFPSPEPSVSCIDDLDFFKDFENEFPAIVYNDALTSKSDFSIEPTLCPQYIDKFDLKDETLLSEYNEEEQNVLYFNDLFPFNIIYPDDLNSDKGNDDNKIDIIQSSGDMAFPLRDYRHQYLRYEGLQYTDANIADFETRLAKIYRREVHRVQVFDFGGLLDLMAEGLSSRMLIKHRDAQGQSLFTSQAWSRLFDIRGPLVHELILEFFSTYRFGEVVLDLDTVGALQFQLGRVRRHMSWREFILALGLHIAEEMDPMLRLCHRLIACSIAGRSQVPKKVTVTELFYLRGMDVGSVNVPYLLARYLRLFASGRKQGATISSDLLVIDMDELVRLQICMELDNTWAWVAPGPERQPDAAAGTPKATKDALVADEGALAVPAPVQAPQPPPPIAEPAWTMAQRLAKVAEDVHEIQGALSEQREILDSIARDFSQFSTWTVVGLSQMMSQARVGYTSYADFQIPYARHTKRRTDGLRMMSRLSLKNDMPLRDK
ncbi:hypothetical protein Tco_0972632 [Tanacetum coccineum]